ncbi:MAG: four helix bundle protein [Ignavibacteria bacterium]|nr:four helix bundle protein [Ignavibacteria bacterium]
MEKGYEKLDIYKLSEELAIEIHKISLSLPKFKMYEEGSQIRRSAKSIPSNIVEGYCLRRHKNEYLQYLHRAFGSCEETSLHLRILFETKSLADQKAYDDLVERYDHLSKMLFRFIEAVSSDHMPPAYVKDQTIEYET